MGDAYFTSDTHFFHKRILELTDRPYSSVEEMNELIVDAWNGTVGKGDRVFHLGDFSFGTRAQTEEMIGRLRGQIHLIRGNHDEGLDRFAGRFASYQDYKEVRINGQKLVLMHYPLVTWNGAHRGAWMLHGHCHGSLAPTLQPRMDVGVDAVGITPLHFDAVAAFMADRVYAPVDHHG